MSEIKTLREKLSILDQKSTEQDQKLTKILFLLENDDKTDSKGLVAQVKQVHKIQEEHKAVLDAHISNYETDKKVAKARAIGYGSAAGTVFGGIITALLKFFTGNTH